MAFDTIQPNNGPFPPQEGGITMREKLKKEMIYGAALALLGFKDDFEEEVAEESSPSLPPLPFRPLRNDIEFHLREIKKNEREKKIEENRELLALKIEALGVFIRDREKNAEEKDIIDRLFFASNMKPEERVHKFLVYYKKNKVELMSVAIVSAAAILSEVRGDSAEEARKDIIKMIGVDPKVKVDIEDILNKGDKTLQELGQALLEYLKGKKQREISGVK